MLKFRNLDKCAPLGIISVALDSAERGLNGADTWQGFKVGCSHDHGHHSRPSLPVSSRL
jgi:hypothetical protein